MTIRLATAADAAAICRIYNQGIQDRVATLETEERSPEERFPGEAGPGGFLDESPGSYLREIDFGTAGVLWGMMNLILVLVIGLAGRGPGFSGNWAPVARLVWVLLLPSAILLLVVTLWQLGNPYVRKSPAKILFALGASLATLGLWISFRGAV